MGRSARSASNCNTQTRSRNFNKPHNPVSTKRGQGQSPLLWRISQDALVCDPPLPQSQKFISRANPIPLAGFEQTAWSAPRQMRDMLQLNLEPLEETRRVRASFWREWILGHCYQRIHSSFCKTMVVPGPPRWGQKTFATFQPSRAT